MRLLFDTLIIILLLIPVCRVRGQLIKFEKSSLEGAILDDSTSRLIPYAEVFNESKRYGTIANNQGHFNIKADKGDTLVISALGYLGKVIVTGDLSPKEEMIITLVPRRYPIEAVTIRRFRNYADFQQQFIALDLKDARTELLRENLATLSRSIAIEANNERKVKEALNKPSGTFITYGIPIRGRDDRQRENLDRVLKEEDTQRIIDKKYNREIIYEITLLSEKEVTDFIRFCNFSKEYLLNATGYDIRVKIEQKFKEYLARKSSGELPRDHGSDLCYSTWNKTPL